MILLNAYKMFVRWVIKLPNIVNVHVSGLDKVITVITARTDGKYQVR